MDAVGDQIHPVRTDLGGNPAEIIPIFKRDHRTDLEHQYRRPGELIDHLDDRPVMPGLVFVPVGDFTAQGIQCAPPIGPGPHQTIVIRPFETPPLIVPAPSDLAFRIRVGAFPVPPPILALPAGRGGSLADLAFLVDRLPAHRATVIFRFFFHDLSTSAAFLIRRYRTKTLPAN